MVILHDNTLWVTVVLKNRGYKSEEETKPYVKSMDNMNNNKKKTCSESAEMFLYPFVLQQNSWAVNIRGVEKITSTAVIKEHKIL